MTDPIFDPTTSAGQATNPQTQIPEIHQDVFGGSSDIFNNPDMFQVTPETSVTKSQEEEFHLDFDQLQANEHTSAPVEPIVIEPQHVEHQETFEEYQARQNPPQPEIIEQVQDPEPVIEAVTFIEPEMKPEVKINPRKQQVQVPAPRPQVQAPAPRPQVQAPTPRPQVQAPAPRPQVQAPAPRPQVQAPAPKPQVQAPAPKPQVQAPAPRPQVQVTPQNTSSDLQKKLAELVSTSKSIFALEKKEADDMVELLGANNDKVTILYQITLPDNGIIIKKIETDLDTEEEMVNDLGFVLDTETNSVQVLLDDVLLLDEVEDLEDDPKKKMQVSEKLNKFIFLLSEQQKKIAKEAKEKEEAEQERRRLQDIFRNF